MRDLVFPDGVSLYAHENPSTLAARLAEQITIWLNKALLLKPRATLAVTGGRTPVAALEALSTSAVDWSRVDVVLTDDRWVGERHIDSNAALLRRYLLQNAASRANFVNFKTPHDSPEAACEAIEEALSELSWPIDVVVLGMGRDGHTASLFPGAKVLQRAMTTDEKCVAIRSPAAPHPRVTLSYPALNGAENKILYFTGPGKTTTMSKVLDELDDVCSMPVRGFLNGNLTIYWSDRAS